LATLTNTPLNVKLSKVKKNSDPKRQAILDSAFTQFSRYGFRRTSMEDIAKEMGISRASLYSHFKNKEEIFRCLSESLHEDTLGNAESCLKGSPALGGEPVDLAARVEDALIARFGPFLEVVTQSAHGSEIYDENNRLCGDLVLDSHERFQVMLANAMKAAARAGEIDLKGSRMSASGVAEIIHLGAAGLKQRASDVVTFKKRLHGFVRIFFAGLP
jgi:AcrR family transcriptional regulator